MSLISVSLFCLSLHLFGSPTFSLPDITSLYHFPLFCLLLSFHCLLPPLSSFTFPWSIIFLTVTAHSPKVKRICHLPWSVLKTYMFTSSMKHSRCEMFHAHFLLLGYNLFGPDWVWALFQVQSRLRSVHFQPFSFLSFSFTSMVAGLNLLTWAKFNCFYLSMASLCGCTAFEVML